MKFLQHFFISIFFFIFFSLHIGERWGGAAFSQSSTLEFNKETQKPPSKNLPDAVYNRVMIIPFEPKMYMSQADREISEKTGKTQEEIREVFRKGICNNVFIEAKMVHNSV